jgi:hypothetical protein
MAVRASARTGDREWRGLAVRIGSRSGRPAFDWNADPATWLPLLQRVTAAYITYYPDLGIPGAAEQIRALAQLADSSRHRPGLGG